MVEESLKEMEERFKKQNVDMANKDLAELYVKKGDLLMKMAKAEELGADANLMKVGEESIQMLDESIEAMDKFKTAVLEEV